MNHNSPEIPHKAQAEDPTQHRNCFIYHSDATDAEYDLNLAQRFAQLSLSTRFAISNMLHTEGEGNVMTRHFV